MDFIPSKEEEKRVKTQAEEVITLLNSKLDAEVVLGGSVAKGTWLPNPSDIDIFVRFNDDEGISERVEKAIPEATRVKGSRDYFQLKYKDYVFEIIPILKIEKAEEAKNITDVSPLHTIWVKKNSDQKLRDEIRKLKQFCKAQRVYGAESYLHGLSGYVIEILTVNYGSFENVIKAVSRWKKPVVDVEKHHKNIEFELNTSKITPLVVIDPVQKGRNAAAAVSEEKLNLFIKATKDYLKGKEDMFQMKELKLPKNSLVFEIEPLEGRKDAIGCKLEKIFNHIRQVLENNDFEVKKSDWEWEDKATMFFQFDNIEKIGEKEGPLVEMEEHVKEFKKKYPETSEKDGRLIAKYEREFTSKEEVFKILIDEYVKERCKSVEIRFN